MFHDVENNIPTVTQLVARAGEDTTKVAEVVVEISNGFIKQKREIDKLADIEKSQPNIPEDVSTRIDIIKETAKDLLIRSGDELAEGMQAACDALS